MREPSVVTPAVILRKESLYEFLIFVFLLTSYLNTVLRLNPESDITVFRLLLPLAFLCFVFLFKTMMVKYVTIVFVFLIYGIVNSVLISRFETFNLSYFLHYGTLIFLVMLTFEIIRRFGVQSVYKHLRFVYIVMIGLAVFQFIYSFKFPNTLYRNTLNIYYWVENDFSAALASFIPFLLVAPDKKSINRFLALIGIFIIVYNDSRIALLSIVFFLAFLLLNRFKRLGYILSAFGVVILFVVFRNYKLGGNTLYQLLADPFGHIFTLTRYLQYGSVYDRTNALIFGITELFNTWGFGVGPGNVTSIYKLPEYYLRTAQSMHNFVGQVIVEYGWLMIFMVIYALVQSYNLRRRLGIERRDDRLLYVYFLTMALASLSQSEGLFSNYFFFIALFASVAYFGNDKTRDNSSPVSESPAEHDQSAKN